MEKRAKSLEQDLLQSQEDHATSERQRRAAESELAELLEEGTANKGKDLQEEKRRLEGRINSLEEELEEEQSNSEALAERLRKSTLQLEQLTAELQVERSNSAKLEASRSAVEKMNKELKIKLAEVEASARVRSKSTIQLLESKLSQLEEQLEVEGRERLALQKAVRRGEKRVKEAGMQVSISIVRVAP